MRVWGMVLGGYPRGRLARYTLRDRERGRLAWLAPSASLVAAHAEVIGAQKAAGLPVVVDGMLDWHDILRPFAASWRNVSIDGLLRFFDNNFFYRIPVFTGEPDIIEPVLAPRVREFSLLADPAALKVVVPGPVTFLRLSRNKSDLSDEDLADKIANTLRVEVELAFEAGAGMVQVDEPFLGDIDATRDDATLAVELVNKIVKGFEERSVLAVYFQPPHPQVYEEILNVKTKYLAVDLVDLPDRAEKIVRDKGFGGHVPVLGLIDARRIYDDDLAKASEKALSLAKGYEELVISTSAWLDLIPHRYALRKTLLLGSLVERIAAKAGGEAWSLWG